MLKHFCSSHVQVTSDKDETQRECFIHNRTIVSLPTALLLLQEHFPSDPLETRTALPSIYIYFPSAPSEGKKKPNRTGIAITTSVLFHLLHGKQKCRWSDADGATCLRVHGQCLAQQLSRTLLNF